VVITLWMNRAGFLFKFGIFASLLPERRNFEFVVPAISGKMKSAFGSKRKARKIQVDEEEEGDGGANQASENTRKSFEATATNMADREKPADGVL